MSSQNNDFFNYLMNSFFFVVFNLNTNVKLADLKITNKWTSLFIPGTLLIIVIY